MSKRYQGNIISKTPVAPANAYSDTPAPGVWSIAEAEAYTKAGLWPNLANGATPIAYYSRQDNTNESGYIYNYYNVGTAISSDGYTARCYAGRNSGYSRYYNVIQCFDEEGNLNFWKYDGFSSRYDATQPYDVCIDDSYVYFVYGYYEYPITSVKDRVYMTCFDRDTGAVQWNRMYNNLRVVTNNAVGHRLDNGASGELVMAGKYQSSASNGGYIARISKTDGSIVASKLTSDGYSQPIECHGIRYLDGTILCNLGYSDWSVNNALTTVNACAGTGTDMVGFDAGPSLSARLTTGQLIVMNHSFTRQWGIATSGETVKDVMIDSDDNVYLVYDNASKVTKWDSSGTLVWQRSFGASNFGVNSRPVGSRIRNGMFTANRNTGANFKNQGIYKLKEDGSGTGTYGDFVYSSTTKSFSTDTTTPSTRSGSIANDIGSDSSQSVTWYDQGGTNTETVYTIT